MKLRKVRIAAQREEDFKKGEKERALMEQKANSRRIGIFSGWGGNEKFVQNIWVSLPRRMLRTEFKERLKVGFSDVGEI